MAVIAILRQVGFAVLACGFLVHASGARTTGDAALTTDQFVTKFARALNVTPNAGPTFLRGVAPTDPEYGYYGALGYAVPNRFFDGKQWQVQREQPVDLAGLIRSFVIWSGVVLYPDSDASQYVAARGLDISGAGFDMADTVYLATVLCNRADDADLAIKQNKKVDAAALQYWVSQLKKSLVARPECAAKSILYTNESRQTPLTQHYFPDGPMFNLLNVGVKVPPTSTSHQYSSIFGSAIATNTKVNTVGIWGEAKSEVSGGRVWGGFFTAETPSDAAKDSQLVGVEVDVINRGKSGVEPNQSKIGIQLVTIGDADSSAAIEIISDHRSRWKNGILIADDAISSDGVVLGLGQRQPMRAGIDFSQGKFSDSAIRLANGANLRFDGANGAKAGLMRNDANNVLVFVAGAKGVAIQNNDATKILVFVSNSGDVVFENARPVLVSPSGKRFAMVVDDDGKLSTRPVP